ncbi:3-oxoacyl-[acyl-carrier-protein] synthase III C-terminal domain-containing protein [Simiduia agarivorans]|uniref:3-oxoacyl-(Acyl carrier protein) synthase III n=1 Tax=Simiduia agarivorans (strain DSM 21679 / JCM 13881 / BCRC 17597 / SA1) TaxID=1117647 RepID=K4L2J6_SIMAS|nr:3-oxoacyl-[acyl-carrier-protein] synthase III C-terminal domain-containing protein [Simiduia agarivorans]AFV00418.1 3-oxoacyl-(acyl carrier protein) synthase III [Simiduia agarivorans SA1 = DSM 21679]
MPQHVHPLRILGSSWALPGDPVSSLALDAKLNLPAGRIAQVSGVTQRYFCPAELTAATMAAQAVEGALANAGLRLDQIDALVATSGTMDQGLPSNAALILHELKGPPMPAFDINASCLSFLAALDNLRWPLAAGRYRRIVLVAADVASCGLNWDQLEESAIFGDGAAAVVIGGDSQKTEQSRILASQLTTYAEGAHFCEIPAGGSRFHPSRIHQPFAPLTRFKMDGKKVFRLAAEKIPGFIDELLDLAQLSLAEIDWVVPHQASHLALSHLERRLGIPSDKVINIFAGHGNQVAASLPTALAIAIHDGRIQRGHKLLLIGTGAGLSIGGAILEY